MEKELFTADELAQRWGISTRTLRRWRSENEGPPYIKIGARKILYKIEDIKSYEVKDGQ